MCSTPIFGTASWNDDQINQIPISPRELMSRGIESQDERFSHDRKSDFFDADEAAREEIALS
jgi:hypothetical protein